ncbi:MAG: hypothetical protein KF773_32835 [Deltaproteobacteria bacterium]|nr:hypothetical protein [Deltaproteobacteria bacterium]
MGRDRLRLLLLGGGSLLLLALGALVLDWFELRAPGVKLFIDLRALRLCEDGGACVTVAMTKKNGIGGTYPTLASIAFWSALAYGGLVAFQAGTRILTGAAPEVLTRIGYLLGVLVFLAGGSAAYLFGPEPASNALLGVSIARTFGPLAFLAGTVAGLFALYLAVGHGTDDLAEPLPPARVAYTPMPVRAPTAPVRAPTVPPAPVPERTTGPTMPRGATSVPIPVGCAGVLAYATLTVELTGGGLDARREDRTSVLVLWRDVVGVVARRMPADYASATFVDVVSTAGSTVRILPWTRVTGVAATTDDDARARSIVELVTHKCPAARVDPATRAFLDGRPAAQLPDLTTLAAHDARLA